MAYLHARIQYNAEACLGGPFSECLSQPFDSFAPSPRIGSSQPTPDHSASASPPANFTISLRVSSTTLSYPVPLAHSFNFSKPHGRTTQPLTLGETPPSDGNSAAACRLNLLFQVCQPCALPPPPSGLGPIKGRSGASTCYTTHSDHQNLPRAATAAQATGKPGYSGGGCSSLGANCRVRLPQPSVPLPPSRAKRWGVIHSLCAQKHAGSNTIASPVPTSTTPVLPHHKSPWTSAGVSVRPSLSNGRSSRGMTLPNNPGSRASNSSLLPPRCSRTLRTYRSPAVKHASQLSVQVLSCGRSPL